MSKSVFPEKIICMLHEHDFGILATSGMEYPYTSLVTIIISDDSHYLVFPTLRETRKYTNLLHDAHVSVLLDNRSTSGKDFKKLYALSVLGTAREIVDSMLTACKEQFLQRHPHLSDFLSLPQTALIQVTFAKLILVEEFEKIREFDCSLQ
jgi:nitroimidazol reductase NimA-like FMN-containing flavoprotein (pyridoxamine 5'-phosphate oxidase superfamily)